MIALPPSAEPAAPAIVATVRATLERLAGGRGSSFSTPLRSETFLWKAFVAGARRWPSNPVVVGAHDRLCYRTAAFLWPRRGGLAFGYALSPQDSDHPGAWISHGWLVDDAGVVECTPWPRDGYVGCLLPAALAAHVVADQRRLAFDQAIAGEETGRAATARQAGDVDDVPPLGAREGSTTARAVEPAGHVTTSGTA